eukprot:TRINITY_DN2029_c0_g1_i2.p1 TRINITY_DN2029_c0_g1~~TRINITY_DN2029_c0_g1_i2.p1  ORF type:complete len:190 (+),score=43.21 TRINITY_DN2029_c0_g1_i2:2-571(+)
MIRRPPRSTPIKSSAASDVYKRQVSTQSTGFSWVFVLVVCIVQSFYYHKMATGVKVDPEVISAFNDFKMSNKHRYMIFKVSDDSKSIVLEKKGDISATYKDFVAVLPAKDCRYGVVNFEYSTESDGNRSKIVFVNWAPETSAIKSKMVYAGTKNDIRKALVGVSIEVQATDLSEVDEGEVLARLKTVSK